MPRLPVPGADGGQWGHILNEFLAVELNSDGTIKDGAITAAKIGTSAVTTSKLINGAVTTDKITDAAVTSAKLDTGAVTSSAIGANAVTNTALADDAVTVSKITNGAITEDKLAVNAVTINKIADDTITNAKISVTANIAQSKIANLVTDTARPKYDWAPTDHNLLAWTDDPKANATGQALSAAGTLHLVRLHVPVAATVNNIIMQCTGEVTTPTAGQNFAALFTSAGVLLAQTADQSAAWSTQGLKTMALSSSQALSVGDYYVGVWANAVGMPAFARGSALSAQFVNVGLTAPNLRVATADAGLTTTAPATFGAQSNGSRSYWAGLS